MTALFVFIIGFVFLQQPKHDKAGWVPQRIEDLKYPRLANYALIQGTVRLEISVDETGAVRDAKVIQGHPLLARAVLENVKRWTFRKDERQDNSTDTKSSRPKLRFKASFLSIREPPR